MPCQVEQVAVREAGQGLVLRYPGYMLSSRFPCHLAAEGPMPGSTELETSSNDTKCKHYLICKCCYWSCFCPSKELEIDVGPLHQ